MSRIDEFHIGSVFSVMIFDLDWEEIELMPRSLMVLVAQ